MRVRKTIAVIFLGGASVCASFDANAQCSSVPNALTNGQATDATKVMGNFNHLQTCLNSGQLTVPSVPSVSVTGPGGGTITIDNPTSSTPYTLSLPPNPGVNGQFLSTNGAGVATWQYATATQPPPLVDGIPVGRPAASSLTWMNQGTASFTEYTNGPISLAIPSQSGDQLRGLGQSPPDSTPYTMTAKIDAFLWGANYSTAGIYVRDNAGKLLGFHQQGKGRESSYHSSQPLQFGLFL